MSTTIKDIAEMAQVSVATVSRVINGNGYVKKETKETIENLLKQTGYTPTARAQKKILQNSHTVAVVLPSLIFSFYSEILQGILSFFDTTNIDCMIFLSHENPSKELEVIKNMKYQKFSGVIISPASMTGLLSSECIEALGDLNVPVVIVGRDTRYTHFDNIFMEEEGGAFDAVSLLLKNGHKRIGFLCGDRKIAFMNQRFLGYEAALTSCSIPLNQNYIKYGSALIEDAYEMTDELFHSSPRPTAIFSSDNVYTLGLVKYLLENNLTIGKDIAVVAYGDIPQLSIFKISITAVAKETENMGALSAKVLLQRISQGNTGEIVRTALIPEIKLRNSEKLLPSQISL